MYRKMLLTVTLSAALSAAALITFSADAQAAEIQTGEITDSESETEAGEVPAASAEETAPSEPELPAEDATAEGVTTEDAAADDAAAEDTETEDAAMEDAAAEDAAPVPEENTAAATDAEIVSPEATASVSPQQAAYAAASEESDSAQDTDVDVPDDFPDQKTLEQAYTEHRSSSDSATADDAGSRLTGQDKILYDACRKQLQKVADGKDEDEDGKIEAIATVSAHDMLAVTLGEKLIADPDNNRYYVNASDIGITQEITEKNIDVSDRAVRELLTYNPNAIIRALLADCPYDLYWFDKTQKINRTTQPYYYVTKTSGKTQRICFDNTRSTVSMRFPVSSDYISTDEGSTRFTVDAYKTIPAVSAGNNARQIVKAAQDSGKSDLEILQSYRQTICDLTDYDYDTPAIAPYGNPWQMIYVFDNDASTKVTCEGYAKAMQYLCDETAFQDSSVKCNSVTGYLLHDSAIQSHMWNIIHWTDGNNYLADLTNSDDGTAGAGGKLFMVPVNYWTAADLADDLAQRLRAVSGKTDLSGYSATVNAGTPAAMILYYMYDTDAEETFSSDQLLVYSLDPVVSDETISWNGSGLNDGNGYTLTLSKEGQDDITVTSAGTIAVLDLPAGEYTLAVSETDALGRKYISAPVTFTVVKKEEQKENRTPLPAEKETSVVKKISAGKETSAAKRTSTGKKSAASAAAGTSGAVSPATDDRPQSLFYTVTGSLAAFGLALLSFGKRKHS